MNCSFLKLSELSNAFKNLFSGPIKKHTDHFLQLFRSTVSHELIALCFTGDPIIVASRAIFTNTVLESREILSAHVGVYEIYL